MPTALRTKGARRRCTGGVTGTPYRVRPARRPPVRRPAERLRPSGLVAQSAPVVTVGVGGGRGAPVLGARGEPWRRPEEERGGEDGESLEDVGAFAGAAAAQGEIGDERHD